MSKEEASRDLPPIFAIQWPEWIGEYTSDQLSNYEYHQSPGISKSTVDQVHRSIDHWLNHEWEETRSLQFGTACHLAVLEPNEFAKTVDYTDVSPRTSQFKRMKQLQESLGGMLLTEDRYKQVLQAADAVYSHPVAGNMIPIGGEVEKSFYVEDPPTGILRKCRADLIVPDKKLIIDLKTTRCAEPESFASSCTRFRYDVSHAWYTDTVALHYGDKIGSWKFKMIAVENNPPFNVAVYSIHRDDVDAARQIYRNDLDRLMEFYMEEGFTGYPGTDKEGIIRINGWRK